MKKKIRRLIHWSINIIAFICCITMINFIYCTIFRKEFNFIQSMIGAINCIIGTFLYWGIIFITHRNKTNSVWNEFYEQIFNAIDSITKGNFSVRITNKDEHYHVFDELAAKVNNMARQLKSMEDMRQEFVANVSHEIQSPLTSIKGFADLLCSDDLSKEEEKSYIHIIQKESMRLSTLSNNLLKLSGLDADTIKVNKKKYRVDKQLREAVLSLEPQWSIKNINFDMSCPGTIIEADEELMKEVWINLINNAVKFTKNDGNIAINILKQENNFAISIKDNGIGMDKEDLNKIFERFYVVDKARKRENGGNGLGLAITKKIVDIHGFSIQVKSEFGKGSEFIICIPEKS